MPVTVVKSKQTKTLTSGVVGSPFATPWPAATRWTAAPLPLREAEHIYTPVCGTSQGSRYFYVGRGDDLRLAVRWRSGFDLSIRVEPPQEEFPTGLKPLLLEMGFGAAGHHFSLHVLLAGLSEHRPNQIFGAVYGALRAAGHLTSAPPDLYEIRK